MPCPLFQPLTRVDRSLSAPARLPLIFEYDGICQAGEQAIEPEHRFQYCNQGNARSKCRHFPLERLPSSIRFAVTAATPQHLTFLIIEEEAYWPKAWSTIRFQIQEQKLVPEIEDVCRRAQAFQFCLNYLETTK